MSLLQRYKLLKEAIKNPGRRSSDLFVKYPPESTFDGKKVLNLGCGKSAYPAKNVTNLDFLPGPGVEVVWDLSKTPLPFDTNEFDYIIANHVLEHVPNWWECFKEMARVLKVGGTIEVWVPPISSDTSFGYRDHINRICNVSFQGTRGSVRYGGNIWEQNDFNNLGFAKDLELIKYEPHPILTWWTVLAPFSLYKFMIEHLRNVVFETGYFFKKLTPLSSFDEYARWGRK